MNRLPGLVLRMECTELDAIFEWVLPFYIRNPERIPEKITYSSFRDFFSSARERRQGKIPPPRNLTRKEDSLNNKSNKKFLF